MPQIKKNFQIVACKIMDKWSESPSESSGKGAHSPLDYGINTKCWKTLSPNTFTE